MRIHLVSDLHTEFAPFGTPEVDADVTVVAGDAAPGIASLETVRAVAAGRPAIFVAGNHEFYRHAAPHLTKKLREAAEGTAIRVLENDAAVLGGVRFLGCTLWTDFDLFGDARRMEVAGAAGAAMNDFRLIRRSPEFRRFRPGDARQLHKGSLAWLQRTLDEPFDGPTVVVTHHAPSVRSVRPEFREDPLSAAYASDLEPMMDGERVALWLHGHTHHCVDYAINGTRIVANQRGYPEEATPGFRPDFVVEVG